MKKIVTYLAVAVSLALAVTLVPTAEAGCGFLQTIAQFNGTGSYGYVRFGPGQSAPAGGAHSHAGPYWEPLGLRGDNADACGADDWLLFFGDWYINANTSKGCVTNCINGNAVVVAMDQINSGADANIVVAVVPEETTRAVQFDMTPSGGSNGTVWPVDMNAAPIPAARVTSSARAGSNVNVDLAFDDVAGFFYDGGAGVAPNSVITGYTLYTQTLSKPATDPGRAASNWGAVVETVDAVAGGSTRLGFPVDCSNPDTEVWVAAGLVIDGYDTEYLSAPTRIECNANLADPKFKLIDRPSRPGKGPKKDGLNR